MSLNTVKKHRLVLVLITFFAATNIIWIVLDQSPPWWDMASHSTRSLEYFRALEQGDFGTIIHDPEPHPPLQYFLTTPFFALFGVNENIPQISLIVSLVLLCLSVYFLTLEITKKKDTALFAVFLVMTYPLFTHFSRVYFLDFTLTALVSFSIFALLKTNHFRYRNWTLLAAISISLGLLTKWSAVVFIAGPAGYLIAQTLRDKTISRDIRKKQILDGLMMIVVILLISLPWYSQHIDVIKELARDTQKTFQYLSDIKQLRPLGITNLTFYLLGRHALAWALSWPLLLLFFFGAIHSFIPAKAGISRLEHITDSRLRGNDAQYLLSWFIVPYLFFTLFISTKEIRHILPLIPVIGIITAISLQKYKKITIVMIFFGSLLWLETSWGVRLIGRSLEIFSNPPKKISWLEVYGYPVQQQQNTHVAYGYSWPTRYNNEIKKLVKKIEEDKNTSDTLHQISRIAVIPNYQYLTGSNIKWYGELINLQADYDISRILKYPNVRPIDVIDKIDYLIMKDGYQGPPEWNKYAPTLWQQEENSPHSEIFAQLELIGQWTITTPEDSHPVAMKLYKRKK